MPRQRRRDLPDRREITGTPSEWLHWYQRNLRSLLSLWRQRKVDREDVELLLLDRSDLEQTLKANPEGLSPSERRRLAKLDDELRKMMPLVEALLPDIADLRRDLGVPKSHWWWFPKRTRERGISEPESNP